MLQASQYTYRAWRVPNVTRLICKKQRDLCKPEPLGSTDAPCQVEVRLQAKRLECSKFLAGLQQSL